MKLRVLLVLAASVALALAPVKVAMADSPVETRLTLSVPGSAELGKPLRIEAVLVDSAGKPVGKAPVGLYTSATFLSVASGPMEIDRAVTDASGKAVFEYLPTRAVNTEVRAEFAGNGALLPSHASGKFTVDGNTQIVRTHAGFSVPFLNKWILGGLLIIIWSLYLFVVSRVLRVAQARHN
ncbi:MAG: hypothetical protein HYX90_06390 [Chloroflexi bacterium]|nr:hypothetical protein [Chloroflexota bacterium]